MGKEKINEVTSWEVKMVSTLQKIILLSWLLCVPILLYGDYTIEWIDTLDNGANDWGNGVAIDNNGNIIVTGESWTGASYDYYTVKYNSSGNILWRDAIDNGPYDLACDVATDRHGGFVVSGYCRMAGDNYNIYTVKYDSSGTIQWANTIDNAFFDFAGGVATDDDGNVVVTGSFYKRTDLDGHIAKYDSSGTFLWGDTIDIDDDYFNGVATDAAGNIIAVGSTGNYAGDTYDCLTVKYAPSGEILWLKQLDMGLNECLYEAATDGDGNIVVAGFVYAGGNNNYLIVKYDSSGDTLWTKVIDNGDDDRAMAVAIDSGRDIIVTGVSAIGGNQDYYTVKYSSSGSIIWADTIDNGADDWCNDVAIDANNNIIITGCSQIGGDWDYCTVKYRYNPGICDEYNVEVHSSDCLLLQNYPNPFKSRTMIPYILSKNCHARLEVYNSLGQRVAVLVDQRQTAGYKSVSWDGTLHAAGVYFYRLQTPNFIATNKMVLNK